MRHLWPLLALVCALGCVDLTRPAGLDCAGDRCAAGDGGPGPRDGARSDAPARDAPDATPQADAPPPPPLGNGAACGPGAVCESGFCVDGLCCATACQEACHACNLPGAAGTCAPVADGADPRGDCAPEAAATCGRDGLCNGRGACRLHPAGTTCAPGSCAGSTERSPRTCDGLGVCRPAAMKPCDPFRCDGDRCSARCAAPDDCTGTSTCEGGRCTGLLPAGAACTAAEQCLSAYCVDGLCCTGACKEGCHACNLPGAEGTCAPVPAGQDPGEECAAEAAATCGRDGVCDGRGACRLHAAGVTCAGPSCAERGFSPARGCDGQGACRPAAAVSCKAYGCTADKTACRTACATSADCAPAHVCDRGACVAPRPLGAACASGGECASGVCAQGVCCGTACAGGCRSCALAGSAGTCSPVPAGQDPLDACADQGAASCGADGACDGAGACRLYAASTSCAAAACTAAGFVPARSCDGAGACRPAAATACGAFACTATGCRSSCAAAADCAAGFDCVGGTCARHEGRRAITIDRTKVGGTSISGFPLLVSVTAPWLKTVANGGSVASAAGHDLSFRALDAATCGGAAGCTLDHEIERYDGAAGQLVAWVRVPSLRGTAASANTTIYVYYGNPAVTADGQRPAAVWSGYAGVWHMNETTGPVRDSTGGFPATPQGGPALGAAGRIGRGVTFDGVDDHLSAGHVPLDNRPFSVAFWMNTKDVATQRTIFSQAAGVQTGQNLHVQHRIDGKARFSFWNDDLDSTAAPGVGAWHHVVMTYTPGGTRAIYLNGAQAGYASPLGPYTGTTGSTYLGALNDTSSLRAFYAGTLDEVQIATTALSPDFVKALYNNQSAPQSFVTIGAAEAP